MPPGTGFAGQVRIRVNDPATGEIVQTFTNTSGLDFIQSPSGPNGFLFVDQVPAAFKPVSENSSDPSVLFGIKVSAGTNGKLRLEASAEDTDFELFNGTKTIRVIDNNDAVGHTTFQRVSELTIRTNDVEAGRCHGDSGTGTEGKTVLVKWTFRGTPTLMVTWTSLIWRPWQATGSMGRVFRSNQPWYYGNVSIRINQSCRFIG